MSKAKDKAWMKRYAKHQKASLPKHLRDLSPKKLKAVRRWAREHHEFLNGLKSE